MHKLFVQLINSPPALLVFTLILVLVAGIIGPGNAQADPGWYNANWQYRKKITINSANVTANLTNFPVLISLASDTDLGTDAQNDGDDILFTASDETTQLSHEIESFNGTTGKLVAWVKIPSLSSTVDTDIYMYYGYAGASNQEDVTNVWDSNFKMVQHLEETTGGTNAIIDSTANSNNGTDTNSPTLGVTGQIDGATSFNGTNAEYINFGSGSSLDITDNITVEAWIKLNNQPTSGYPTIISKPESNDWIAPYANYHFRIFTDSPNVGKLEFFMQDNLNTKTYSTTIPQQGQWYHVAATYDNSDVKIYVNGQLETTNNVGSGKLLTSVPAMGLGMGARNPPSAVSEYFNGIIDEGRISSIDRSAGWIKTSYNNQNNPSDFLTLGSEQTEVVAPTVTTDAATLVEETTATLNGTLDNDGGEANQYSFEWGTSPGVYTANISWTGSVTTGQSFSTAISSLSKGTKYYFRARTINSAGIANGSELSFLTKPDEPTSLSATAISDSQINLSWSKGAGANNTLVRRKTSSYPTSISDGTQVYFSTSTSTSDTGLDPGTKYFYSAWSEVTGSQQYSDAYATANATTTGSPPTAVGGIVLPINKATVLAPWLFLGLVASLAIARIIWHFRKREWLRT